ncbi:uncharacterized protein LOC144916597 [Branchiostoma floridae x Branchiostoma belcheri]
MGRKLRHVLVFLLIILKEPSMPEAACRSKCDTRSCSYRGMGLTSIPQDLPTTISGLDLGHNLITSYSLTIPKLPRLKKLYLHSNQITMIQAGTVANLPQLQELYLNNNQITMIQAGALANLPQLQELYLNNNQITMIQAGALANLPQLKKLYLSHNRIITIQAGTLENLPRLRSLLLQDNPWRCNCSMVTFMSKFPFFKDQIICAQPAKFKGQKLKDFNPVELKCEDPTQSTPRVDAQNTFVSTAMPKSSSFLQTDTNPGPTAHAVGSTLPIQTQAPFTSSAVSVSSFGDTESLSPGPRVNPPGSTFTSLPSATQQKVKTAAKLAFPFPTTGTSPILFTANKPEITRCVFQESSPSVSIPALIGSVCGTAALSIVATVLITIWCKRNTKNTPSGPTSNIALSNINTTATAPTSGSLHDQTGQGQALASSQPLNIEHPKIGTGTGSFAPHRDGPPLPDDDEPTYVEPDGAHYMTPEDVLYEMPANSHCEDDNRHYYQPLKKEQNLPTDADGYVLVVPNKGQC